MSGVAVLWSDTDESAAEFTGRLDDAHADADLHTIVIVDPSATNSASAAKIYYRTGPEPSDWKSVGAPHVDHLNHLVKRRH